MDSIDCAWVAGILDGEGCFTFVNQQTTVTPLISVAMSDFDTIERLLEVTGVGHITEYKVPSGRKPMSRWCVSNRRDVARILLAIYPLMSRRRQGRIAELTEVVGRIRGSDNPWCRNGHQDWGVKPSTGHRYCKSCYRAAHHRWVVRQREE